MKLQQIHPDFRLEGATFGEQNARVVVIRLIDGPDIWEQVPNTRMLVIGGAEARRELSRLVDARGEGISRRELQDRGIASDGRTHQSLREWVGLT